MIRPPKDSDLVALLSSIEQRNALAQAVPGAVGTELRLSYAEARRLIAQLRQMTAIAGRLADLVATRDPAALEIAALLREGRRETTHAAVVVGGEVVSLAAVIAARGRG